MDQDLITSLSSELQISEELARRAMEESQGELQKAREILEGLLPKYLFIKVRFLSSRLSGNGGLIFIIAEKGADKFLIFRTVVENDRDWINTISVHSSPEDFLQHIKDYFSEHSSNLCIYDAQKLKDKISAYLTPSNMQYLFSLWDTTSTESQPITDPTESYYKLDDILHNLINSVLNDILVDRLDIEVDYDFYTEAQFEEISESLGLNKPEDSRDGKSGAKGSKEELKVYFKGRFSIDPIKGVLSHELEVGDTVYCEIVDRSEIAKTVSELIGAYRKGLWLPVRGRIVEIHEAAGDRQRFRLILGKGIYVDIISYRDIKVRCFSLTNEDRILLAGEISTSPGMLPLLIAVILLTLLIFILLALQ